MCNDLHKTQVEMKLKEVEAAFITLSNIDDGVYLLNRICK